MSRDQSVANKAEIDAISKNPAIFYEAEFAGSPVNTFTRLWTGVHEITALGQSWQGVGHLASLSPIKETTDVYAAGIVVGLSGLDATRVSEILQSVELGLGGTVYLGFLNNAGALVDDPEILFQGLMDVPQIEDDGTSATITISYESRLRDGERPRPWRYTPESQKKFYPDDEGYEFISALVEWNGTWGK